MPYKAKHARRVDVVTMHPANGRPYPKFQISYKSPIEKRDQIRMVARRRFNRDVHVDMVTCQIADPRTAEIVGGFFTKTVPGDPDGGTR